MNPQVWAGVLKSRNTPKRIRKSLKFAILYGYLPMYILCHDKKMMKKCISAKVQLDLFKRSLDNYISKLEKGIK